MSLAFVLPLAVMSGVALCHLALCSTLVSSPARGHPMMVPAVFVGVFLAGGLLGEEFGWRGYALPALQKRYGWRVASLVIGAVWSFWRLPLFFLVGTTQSLTPVLVFMPMVVALSVLFAWLFNRTGHSVVPALVLHTAFNGWAFLIPTLPSDGAQRPSEMVVGVIVLIALVLLFRANLAAALRVR
jgi:membrane protease YdiL (CAAX protease family)